MVCIYCGGGLAVSNSRPQLTRNQTWRRRLCKACGAVYTSIEAIDLSQALIVQESGQNSRKRDGDGSITESGSLSTDTNLQPFDRDRLFISIYESLRHRPTAAQDARGLADTVTAHIMRDAQKQRQLRDTKNIQTAASRITPRTIAEAILNTLQRFDQAAATHYAAFHRRTWS
jgi:transcriptional regulator NrdR family protein